MRTAINLAAIFMSGNRGGWIGRVAPVISSVLNAIRWITIAALLLAPTSVPAEVTHFESEPNDKPTNFNEVNGAVTLYGNLSSGDQDGYIWIVSPA